MWWLMMEKIILMKSFNPILYMNNIKMVGVNTGSIVEWMNTQFWDRYYTVSKFTPYNQLDWRNECLKKQI